PRHDRDPVTARDGRDDQLRFDHRELAADAAARTAAERDVGEARARRFSLGGEPIRIEALGIGPQPGAAVNDERDQEDERSLAHAVAADFVIGDRLPREAPRRWVQPERFLDDPARAGQPIEVREGQPPAADRTIGLAGETPLYLRML